MTRRGRGSTGDNGTETNGAVPRTVYYIVIPAALAKKLHDRLLRYFDSDPHVAIVVETRRSDRRRADRRGAKGEPPPRTGDRRRVRNLRGRRIAERRAPAVPVQPPRLPRFAEPYADQIVVLERVQPTGRHEQDVETARIVARAQAGDAQAMPELYLRHFDGVYSYMRVGLRDDHEAEDATQEVFLKAVQALPRFELRASVPFRAWLFRIARNELITRVRKSKWVQCEEPDQITRRFDAGGSGVTDMLERISNRDLMVLLERLPLPQRQVIALRYMLDLTTEEMGTVLDRSPEAVRQLEYRARRSLQERLAAIHGRGERRRQAMVMRTRPMTVLRARRFALASDPVRVYTSRAPRTAF
jgi:RNA polymerase sigma-70 factor (ECF subfamily)